MPAASKRSKSRGAKAVLYSDDDDLDEDDLRAINHFQAMGSSKGKG